MSEGVLIGQHPDGETAPEAGGKPDQTESQRPVSRLVIEFAGPGSSEIIGLHPEGVVTPAQMLGAAAFLDLKARHDFQLFWAQQMQQQAIAAQQQAAVMAALKNQKVH